MSDHSQPNLWHFDYLKDLMRTARQRPGLWAIPILSAGLIGVLIAFLGPKLWQATQSFVVREELIGRIVGPGRFESLDTMKTAQETIQELAKKPAVLKRMLLAVGPTSGKPGMGWPSEIDIEDCQGAISFFAPNGAEFGKTEMLMLNVKAPSRQRAKQFAEALFAELQIEVRKLRENRAASMQNEIQQAVVFAEERLADTAQKLNRIETQVGADLSELRSLNDPAAGTGDLRKIYVQIQAEIRGANSQLAISKKQKQHLVAAVQDPSQLLATPRELLALQPALARLKDSLIDAQIKASTLRGKYSDIHPAVVAAGNAVNDISGQIDSEAVNSLRGVESQMALATQKISQLKQQADRIDARLNELAKMRVDYGQVVREMDLRNEELTRVQKEFAQTESIRRAAATVDMITRIDEPQVGTNPIGPSKKALLGGALLAGLFIGIGFVMLVTPAKPFAEMPPQGMQPVPSSSAPAPKIEQPAETAKDIVPNTGLPGAFVLPEITQSGPPQTPIG